MNEPAIKLTSYFDERERAESRFLADVLFDIYESHGMATSVLLRGVHGFGAPHELHTDRLLSLSESLPAVSVAVDTPERIGTALGDVLSSTASGLITQERARVLRGAHAAVTLSGGQAVISGGQAVKLTVYGGRSIRVSGEAGYVAAVRVLRDAGATAAIVLLAVDGTLHGERRRARFFARNAAVPLVLEAIADQATIDAVLPRLATLIADPVMTVELVQVCRSDGLTVAPPHSVPDVDEDGLPLWQKVTVHAEEQEQIEGRPLYVELVRRLGEAGAAGATVLRGVRGFYGHREVADRLLRLRRHAPLELIAIDRPEAVRRWWPVVEELTARTGLVTAEVVPALHPVKAHRRLGALRLARPA